MKPHCVTAFSIYILYLTSFVSQPKPQVWGFFAHRMINRMAVFTLPPELFGFYRQHIEYITEHAVDPDKRRYASKFEDIRHYIDLDHWGMYPYSNLTRDFEDDIIRNSAWVAIGIQEADTLNVQIKQDTIYVKISDTIDLKVAGNYHTFLKFWKNNIKPLYYEDQLSLIHI